MNPLSRATRRSHAPVRGLLRTTVVLAALMPLAGAGAPLPAQDHAVALGPVAGWSVQGDLTPGLAAPTELEAAPAVGGQVEAWLGTGRVALRAAGALSRHDVEGQPGRAFDVLTGDVAFLLRLLPASERPWVVPYLAAGGGASRYAAAHGSAPLGDGAYGDDPVIRPVFVAGIGVDLLPFRHFGLRVEAADRVFFPSLGESPETAGGLPMAHNLELRAALQLRLGSPPPPVRLTAGSG